MPAYFWAILLIATTCQAIWEQVSTGKPLLRGLAPPETRNRVQAVFIAEQAAQMRLLHERDNYSREGAAQSDAHPEHPLSLSAGACTALMGGKAVRSCVTDRLPPAVTAPAARYE